MVRMNPTTKAAQNTTRKYIYIRELILTIIHPNKVSRKNMSIKHIFKPATAPDMSKLLRFRPHLVIKIGKKIARNIRKGEIGCQATKQNHETNINLQ